MSPETVNFVAYNRLEAANHTYRQDHHRHTKGSSHNRQLDNEGGKCPLLLHQITARYKKRQIHPANQTKKTDIAAENQDSATKRRRIIHYLRVRETVIRS